MGTGRCRQLRRNPWGGCAQLGDMHCLELVLASGFTRVSLHTNYRKVILSVFLKAPWVLRAVVGNSSLPTNPVCSASPRTPGCSLGSTPHVPYSDPRQSQC